MAETKGAAPEAAAPDEGGGPTETTLAVIITTVALIGPLLYIQYRYDGFTSESGIAREGAAGAGLALAVVFRTVSRTVLRTLVRTSARAGMRVSMKGAMQSGMRVGTRNLLASISKSALAKEKGPAETDPAAIRRSNMKSLGFATVLLYASWVIVIGLGQPFAPLMNDADAAVAEVAAAEEAKKLADRPRPEHIAYLLRQQSQEKHEQMQATGKKLKGARGPDLQRTLQAQLILEQLEKDVIDHGFVDAYNKAGGRMSPPAGSEPVLEPTAFDHLIDWLFTRAPFPGRTSWSSPVIWGGAAIFTLPLWVIYFFQAGAARRRKLILRHKTGVDGGIIQLYFAGAFSFMPLTSDVVVEGTDEERGRVALVGLLAPTLIAMVLWGAWKATGLTPLLFAADAFLIYPMVQTFPLDPLDGVRVWRWNRVVWTATFLLIMAVFMFAGSEGLKSVI